MTGSHGNQINWGIKKQDNQQYLDNQNGGHAVHKFKMSCLVAEGVHPGDGTNAAANDGDDKEGGFRNPEGTLYCFSFIDSHKGKRH